MEHVETVLNAAARRETWRGRSYLVAPIVSIVPGVLAGSKGRLYYPPEEVGKDPSVWNGTPIVLEHPTEDGRPVSARHPKVLEERGLGFLFNSGFDGKLKHEGWFDEEYTRRIAPHVHEALLKGRTMELSTGLFTTDDESPGVHNTESGEEREYDYVARNYRPDHLAILPNAQGACSVKDGCGLHVNERSMLKRLWDWAVTNVWSDEAREASIAARQASAAARASTEKDGHPQQTTARAADRVAARAEKDNSASSSNALIGHEVAARLHGAITHVAHKEAAVVHRDAAAELRDRDVLAGAEQRRAYANSMTGEAKHASRQTGRNSIRDRSLMRVADHAARGEHDEAASGHLAQARMHELHPKAEKHQEAAAAHRAAAAAHQHAAAPATNAWSDAAREASIAARQATAAAHAATTALGGKPGSNARYNSDNAKERSDVGNHLSAHDAHVLAGDAHSANARLGGKNEAAHTEAAQLHKEAAKAHKRAHDEGAGPGADKPNLPGAKERATAASAAAHAATDAAAKAEPYIKLLAMEPAAGAKAASERGDHIKAEKEHAQAARDHDWRSITAPVSGSAKQANIAARDAHAAAAAEHHAAHIESLGGTGPHAGSKSVDALKLTQATGVHGKHAETAAVLSDKAVELSSKKAHHEAAEAHEKAAEKHAVSSDKAMEKAKAREQEWHAKAGIAHKAAASAHRVAAMDAANNELAEEATLNAAVATAVTLNVWSAADAHRTAAGLTHNTLVINPPSMVLPGQERYWEKAKELAEKGGREEDWAYIVGIFKRMTGFDKGKESGEKHSAIKDRPTDNMSQRKAQEECEGEDDEDECIDELLGNARHTKTGRFMRMDASGHAAEGMHGRSEADMMKEVDDEYEAMKASCMNEFASDEQKNAFFGLLKQALAKPEKAEGKELKELGVTKEQAEHAAAKSEAATKLSMLTKKSNMERRGSYHARSEAAHKEAADAHRAIGNKELAEHHEAQAAHHGGLKNNAWSDAAREASIAARQATAKAYAATRALHDDSHMGSTAGQSTLEDADAGKHLAVAATHRYMAESHDNNYAQHDPAAASQAAQLHRDAAAAHDAAHAAQVKDAGGHGELAALKSQEALRHSLGTKSRNAKAASKEAAVASDMALDARTKEAHDNAARTHWDASLLHFRAADRAPDSTRGAHIDAAVAHREARDYHHEAGRNMTANEWSDAARAAAIASRAAAAKSKESSGAWGKHADANGYARAAEHAAARGDSKSAGQLHGYAAEAHREGERESKGGDRESHRAAAEAHEQAAAVHAAKKEGTAQSATEAAVEASKVGTRAADALAASRKGDHAAAARHHYMAAKEHEEAGHSDAASAHTRAMEMHHKERQNMRTNAWSDEAREASAAARRASAGTTAGRLGKEHARDAHSAAERGDHKAAADSHQKAAEEHGFAAKDVHGRERPEEKTAHEAHLKAADAHRKAMGHNEEADVNKVAKIAWLTANCSCWKGQAETLNGLTDEQLKQLVEREQKAQRAEAVANAAMQGFKSGKSKFVWDDAKGKFVRNAMMDDEDEDEEGKKPKMNADEDEEDGGQDDSEEDASGKKKDEKAAMNAWLKSMPAQARAVWNSAVEIERNERKGLVTKLVANISDDALKARMTKRYARMPLQELRDELAARPASNAASSDDDVYGVPLFAGAAGASNNTASEGEPLVPPAINWAEEVE